MMKLKSVSAKKKGQVWIETVIYTLIGLSLIAIVLAFVTPRISDAKDKAVVSQTISSLNQFDEKINDVLQAPGNVRYVDFTIKRGNFYINTSGDSIIFVIDDLEKPYSEPGKEISLGRIKIISEEASKSKVTLTVGYEGIVNITYGGKEGISENKFTPASAPYRFFIESESIQNGLQVVNIKTSGG